MIGRESGGQGKLFTVGVSLEKRVRADHPLREIAGVVDFNVLSKARRRWGQEVFQSIFYRVVRQCVEAGLVNG